MSSPAAYFPDAQLADAQLAQGLPPRHLPPRRPALPRPLYRWLGVLSVIAVCVLPGCKKKPTDPAEAVVPAKAPPVVRKKPRTDTQAPQRGADSGERATAGQPTPGDTAGRPATAATAGAATAEAAVRPAAPPAAATPVGAQAAGVAAAPAAALAAAAAQVPANEPTPAAPVRGADAGAAAEPPSANRDAAEAPPALPPPPVRREEPPVAPDLPTPTAGAVSGEPALDITGYLSVADLERVLGPKVKLRRGDLPGTPPSPTHNSAYYAPQKGDGFGVALQVWRDPNLAESRTRFNTMRNTYSNVAPTNKIAEQGFRAFFGGVVTLVFADPRRPLVAAVSCSTKVCTADHLIELSKRVAERLR